MYSVMIDMEIDAHEYDPVTKRVEYRAFSSEQECEDYLDAYEAQHCVKVIYSDWYGDLLVSLVKH